MLRSQIFVVDLLEGWRVLAIPLLSLLNFEFFAQLGQATLSDQKVAKELTKIVL